MREAPTYRLELEEILKNFNDRRILSVTDVSCYTGKSRKWCREHLGVSGKGCTAVQLANALSKLTSDQPYSFS